MKVRSIYRGTSPLLGLSDTSVTQVVPSILLMVAAASHISHYESQRRYQGRGVG